MAGLIFFWNSGGDADGGTPPVVVARRRYSVHASKGISTTKGVSGLRRLNRAEGLAHPELTDVDTK